MSQREREKAVARLLVVEDDDDLRFFYQTALAREGHEVVGAANAVEAMLRLTTQDFDAVLLDLQLPDIPGKRVLEFARDDVRLRHVPFAVISANDRMRDEILALGARAFLVKPVPMAQLRALVATLLGA